MPKLTKKLFAAAKTRLGIKKVTKKNIGRIAKAAMKGSGSTKAKTTSSKSASSKKGGRSMGKGKSLVVAATQLAKAGAILVPAVIAATSPGDASHKARVWLSYMSGVEVSRDGKAKLNANRLLVGWGPYVGVSVGSKIASKINGLIRRI